jgi:glycosyltransferase involved in cell wall biosynthesis
MKLNWFSPLPPTHSAIAAYATAVLPELQRHAEVTVWSDAPDVARPERIELQHYRDDAPPWQAINNAVSIYHIGNHALFHAGICELSRRHPGIVVLHDTRLQELAIGLAQLRNDWDGYVAAMNRHHGARGATAAQRLRAGLVAATELVEPFPLTAAFLDRALGVVVHSEEARQMVEAVTAGPILCSPLPYRATRTRVAPRSWQAPFRLIVFGFLGGNRGLDSALATLAAFPQRERFHLDVYGDLPEADRWRDRIHATGLSRHVTLHGFVSDAALAEALDHAHLVLNLRQPSRGEASFSLLQAWDHGLPAIVNRIGWFGELPPTCVAFAEPDRAGDDLRQHLHALLVDPEPYRRMGLAARERLLQQHDPPSYAARLARYAARADSQRGRSNAQLMADRAAVALRDVGGQHLDASALERIGSAIHCLHAPQRPQ